MYTEGITLPCSIIRGGTSKGVFFLEKNLPKDKATRDIVILSVMGSPDIRQIDGLGGANSLTSKVCIVGPSKRKDADVDYTFGQVSVDDKVIDWRGNCGNMTSAVGIFAVSEKLLDPKEPYTKVRIYNTNSKKNIYGTYPVKDGVVLSEGDYSIPGVPGTGSKIKVEFLKPEGSVTKKLLPTGNVKDIIDLGDNRIFTVSIVDAGNPVVFLKAEDIGLNGIELPDEIDKMPEILSLLEEIRGAAAEILGFVEDSKFSVEKSPAYPKIAFVTKSKDYVNTNGENIKEKDIDLVARIASMQKIHKAYAVTGAISTGVASRIKGTIVNEVSKQTTIKNSNLIIGQPYGSMEVIIKMNKSDIEKVGIYRTARKILDGNVYIPNSKIKEL